MSIYELTREIYEVDYSIDSGSALLYLMRRFGFPNSGSDSSKEVCEYLLHTSIRGCYVVYLIGATSCHVRMFLSRKLSDWYNLAPDHATYLTRDIALDAAMRDVLIDTLRPVKVRDSYINILGRVEPSSDYDEEQCRYVDEVPRHVSAGYCLPEGSFDDPELFTEFLWAVREYDNGTIRDNMRKLIPTLQID